MPPPILLLAFVLLIGIGVMLENEFMRRRKPRSKVGNAVRRRALAKAEAAEAERRAAGQVPLVRKIRRFREPLHAKVAALGVGIVMAAGVFAMLGWEIGLFAISLIVLALFLGIRQR